MGGETRGTLPRGWVGVKTTSTRVASVRLALTPQAALVLSALVLVTAALAGRLWTVLSFIPVLVLAEWAWIDGPRFQRLAVWSLFLSQALMVVMWVRPDEFNYYAYAVLLLALAGSMAALRSGGRFDLTLAFGVWLTLSAAYTTLVLRPSPAYALLIVPTGVVGMILLAPSASSAVIRSVLRGLLVFAAMQSVLGLTQTLFDVPPFTALGGAVYEDARNYLAVLIPGMSTRIRMATGTFEHFNGLGALLSIAVPVAYGSWLYERTRTRFFLFALLFAGLIATFSRGALLGVLIGGVLIYWSDARGSRSKSLSRMLLALVGLLAVMATFGAIQEYAEATGNLTARLGAWQAALQVAVSDPVRLLFGSGYGYFGQGFLANQGQVTRLHSAPVQILAELGLIGLGAFIAGVIRPVARGLRSFDPVQNVLAAAATAFLIHQSVDNALFGFPGLFLFAVVGILTARQRVGVQLAPDATRTSHGWRAWWV